MFLIELTPNLDFWSRPHPPTPPPATRQVRSDPLTGGRSPRHPQRNFPQKKEKNSWRENRGWSYNDNSYSANDGDLCNYYSLVSNRNARRLGKGDSFKYFLRGGKTGVVSSFEKNQVSLCGAVGTLNLRKKQRRHGSRMRKSRLFFAMPRTQTCCVYACGIRFPKKSVHHQEREVENFPSFHRSGSCQVSNLVTLLPTSPPSNPGYFASLRVWKGRRGRTVREMGEDRHLPNIVDIYYSLKMVFKRKPFAILKALC